ncbi:MAG: hypothetical protein JRC67_11180, partial [Deltaproteobacteria bacterium]|nr:hypothetical protein [Deltaproteobacteria bacterium]
EFLDIPVYNSIIKQSHIQLLGECGVCARVCPSSAISTTANNYRVLVGGKLGRHPQLARDLTNGLDAEQVLNLVGDIVGFYKDKAKSGERLGALINRVGWEKFENSVLKAKRN